MPAPQKPFRYFDLPGEIRNKILHYVLVPGDIYPRSDVSFNPRKKNTKPIWGKIYEALSLWKLAGLKGLVPKADTRNQRPTFAPQPGFQVLATCKQARSEGYAMFYDLNTFHLPHGPVQNTLQWVGNIQPESRDRIKKVCVTLSIADLTPAALEAFDRWRWAMGLSNPSVHFDRLVVYDLARYMETRLWREKIEFLEGWKSLQKICLQYPRSADWLDRNEVLGCVGTPPSLALRLEIPGQNVEAELRGLVYAMCWAKAREWLMGSRH